jgi:biopolymer transport protein ExbD
MKFKKSREISAYIPTASMADIVFLLIIFFMVASVFPIDKTQIDLPQTETVEDYAEDSAVIAITTANLEWVRQNRERQLSQILDRTDDQLVIKTSAGREESSTILSVSLDEWKYSTSKQYEKLKTELDGFIEDIRLRIQREMAPGAEQRKITIVIKADTKVPFSFPDAVIKALQEVGGEMSKNIAILSKRESVRRAA